MGTTQKGIIFRSIGAVFAAGLMGQNGGHYEPSTSYCADSGYKHGNSKANNRQPRKPQYSLVSTGHGGMATFRNRSTGEFVRRAYKIL